MDPVTAFFESVADSYDEVLPFFATFAAQAADLLGPVAGLRALDVAAGRGALADALATAGAEVVATHAAPRMVELLTRDVPGITAYVADAARLPEPDASYDVVTCGSRSVSCPTRAQHSPSCAGLRAPAAGWPCSCPDAPTARRTPGRTR